MCVNFQAKQTALTLLSQTCPKLDLGLKIQKTNAGIQISIFEILCLPTLTFWPKFAQKWIWGRNFESLNPDPESRPPRYHVCQFSGKTDNFDFFGLNLPKKGFRGPNFKILSLDSEPAPPLYHECQFSGKTNIFEFFGLNLGKLPNYLRSFGFYKVEGAAEISVEA